MERGDTQDKSSTSWGFACSSCPTSSWPALPSLLEESVMYVLEEKIVPGFCLLKS